MDKFLSISGAKGSGKSIIRGLLDGHPQLFVSPFHERIFESFYEDDDTSFLKKKDIEKIREMLANKGHYFQLERQARFKKQPLNVASDIHKSINVDFNYYLFDKSWVDNLYRKGTEWTSQEVCKEIYKSFSKNLSSPFLKKVSKKHYYCSNSMGYPNATPGFVKTFPNSKIIYIKRDPIEIVAALTNRTTNPHNYGGSKWFNPDALFKKWGTFEFIKLLAQLDDEAEKTLKKHPRKILIIKFSDIFENLDKLTRRIRKFLNISDNIALKHYSCAGHKITNSDGKSFLSTRVDNGYGDLSKTQIKKLKSFVNKIQK